MRAPPAGRVPCAALTGQVLAAYARSVAVRVALAEDSYILREGIEQVLVASDDVEVVASCADLDSLRRAVDEDRPDVVLTDIRMPPSNRDEGIRLAAELRTSHPEVGVIVLSQYLEPAYVMQLFETGSNGRAYLLKDRVSDRKQLIDAIAVVANGGSAIDPKVVEVLVEARSRTQHSPLLSLTARELEVLRAIAQGKSNVAIARDLVLTKHAVEKHINMIFSKLGLSSSPEVENVSRRVMATLMFLADPSAPAGGAWNR